MSTSLEPDDVAAPPPGLDLWAGCAALRPPLERRLHEAVDDLCHPLDGPLGRIVFAPGKRLRPALTLAFATHLTAGAPTLDQRSRALDLAVSVELLHSATLVHDDLIDAASTRRAAPTVNAADGTAAAVVGGDSLIAAAFVTAASGGRHCTSLLVDTLLELCHGEAMQNSLRFDADAAADVVLDVARSKTGSLMRAACEFGAYAAGADVDVCVHAGRFGEQFGLVLQLVDDLLDIVSTPALAGKPVGVDFTSGVITPPAVAAMDLHPELRALLVRNPDDLARARSTALLRSADAVRAGVQLAFEHARDARDTLAPVCRSHPGTQELALAPERYVWHQLTTRVDPALAQLLPDRRAS
ncbi:polyprenyl synthetase family protein [uncultured Jatrophihabitans sp.]|uniref:polyprenyl synthetase family protein n=1 Tax=uncultured Jatrophihabitans sp. TaxID=1610747 RepID=UPI0035CB00CB